VLTAGQMLRIVDLQGQQAVDFLSYRAADTMKYAKTIFLTTGHGIYSDMGRRLSPLVSMGHCRGWCISPLRHGCDFEGGCYARCSSALAGFSP
jgi:uncharacterized protein YcgI (DUF1989 family)